MKTTIKLIMTMAIVLLLTSTILVAQEPPQYITVTTMHWNMDKDDFEMDKWIATEKEYLDKVTKKNEHIISAGFYLHRFTPDNREVVYVQTYANWEGIDKAAARNIELAELAWPDETARKAYFDNQGSYYSDFHSDEIYATMAGAKLTTEAPGEDMILYVRKSHFSFPKDGSNEEFEKLQSDFTQKVIHKNEHIKGYYPNAHMWGADRREFVEAFLLNSIADLDKMFERTGELVEAGWPDEAARNTMNESLGKYFTGVHGDYIYNFIEQLSK